MAFYLLTHKDIGSSREQYYFMTLNYQCNRPSGAIELNDKPYVSDSLRNRLNQLKYKSIAVYRHNSPKNKAQDD